MSFDKAKALTAAKRYMLQNNSQAAIEVFRQVVEAEPLDLSSINTLGDLYVRTGQIPEAVDQFSKLADAYLAEGVARKAIAVLKKIMSIDPANTGTWIKLADLYATAGLPGEARQHYLQIADAYSRNGRMNEAIEVFGRVVALDPSNASARIKLGELCRREGLNDQAYEAFITAARQLTTRGETRRAINAYNEALSIRPDSPDALAAVRASASERTLGIQLAPNANVGSSISEAALSSGNLDGSPAKAPPPNTPDERETALVIQEISQAEILVAYGQVNQAIAKLTAVARKLPDNIDVRGKLKDIYLRNGMTAEGAAECRELERIHTSLGDDARARDYAVRASRLTQLVEPSSGDLRRSKPEPTVESEPLTDASFDKAKLNVGESMADASGDLPPRRNAVPLAVVSKPVARVAATLEESPKPVRPLKLISIEDSRPLTGHALNLSADSLVVVPREQLSHNTIASTQESVDTSLVRVVPGPFSDPRSATGKPGRIKVFAIAASIVAVLGAGSVIGRFVFDARLNKQHQELSMAPQPPVTPATETAVATTPAETLQGAEPITVVVDAAGKKPLPSASQPEDRVVNEKPVPIPEPPIVETPKPISKPTAPSPSPPRVSVNPDNHGSGANTVPAGVPVEPPQGPLPSAPPPRPVRVTQGVVMGGAIKRVEPVYPANAREAKQSGVVRVEVSIDERGNVTSVQALSGPPMLRGAALAAARGWRFKPSTIGGAPVKTSSVIDFNFKL